MIVRIAGSIDDAQSGVKQLEATEVETPSQIGDQNEE